MNTSNALILETVTGPGFLNKVHHALDRAWTRNSLVPNMIRISMVTATAEVGANILRHAGKGRAVPLRMEIKVMPDRVVIVFTDEGDQAAIDLDAVSMPREFSKDGRGLALASAVLDRLSYERDNSCNRWTLVSRRFA